MSATGCHHVGLLTNSPLRLTNFYIKKLGFKKEKESSAPKSIMRPLLGIDRDCGLIRLKREGIRLEIIYCVRKFPLPIGKRGRVRGGPGSGCFKPHSDNSIGYSHWALCVKDKVKFCSRLKSKKVPILKAERDGRFVFFLKDPDGNRIEVQE